MQNTHGRNRLKLLLEGSNTHKKKKAPGDNAGFLVLNSERLFPPISAIRLFVSQNVSFLFVHIAV